MYANLACILVANITLTLTLTAVLIGGIRHFLALTWFSNGKLFPNGRNAFFHVS